MSLLLISLFPLPKAASAQTLQPEPDTSLVRLLEFTNTVPMARLPARSAVIPSDAHSHPYKRFAFLYEDETGNRIDTIEGSVTKDLGMRPDTTIELHFSESEMHRLYGELIALGFFDLPRTPTYLDPERRKGALFDLPITGSHYRWIRLMARTDTTVHEVAWNGFNPIPVHALSDDLLRLQDWINHVWKLVVERESYRALPPRREPSSW